MKQLILVLSFLLSTSAWSQNPADTTMSGKLWYGVKVNGNMPVRKKLPADSLAGIVKPGAGLFVAYQFSPWFRPQFEVEYSSLTFKKITDERITNNYLDLGFNFFVTPGRRTNITLNIGWMASITQGTVYRTLNGASLGGLTSRYSNANAGRVDYLFSAGLTFPASSKVDLFAKYHFTLTADEAPNTLTGKTSYLQFGLSVNLNKFISDNQQPTEEQLRRQKNNRALMDGGVLLVRLNYPRNTMKRLIESGDDHGALALKVTYDSLNMQLIRAFKKYYTFTPVYFFVDEKSDRVLSHNFDSLFVNEQMQYDPSIVCTAEKFLIAEVGYVEMIGGNILDNMLVVLDPQFRQMKSPFPYSITNMKLFEGSKRYLTGIDETTLSSLEKNVFVLNQRLISFYLEYYGYIQKQ
ncbi:MAG: hypothetical protein K1X81_05440 [Bacteroidia bacterium]|nr:hypothetical protein [Bacteroidia bacterium]